jgi:hypothetical protein
MVHCTMDDLLAIRENEASVWAKEHLAECATCQAELDALYQRVAALKALPARRPARDRWPAVRAAIRADDLQRRRRWGAWSLSVAAGFALLLLVRPWAAGPANAADLARVKQQSATLENELARYDPDARVTSGRAAALAAALEDRIAVIDGELAQLGTTEAPVRGAELMKLWQQRVDAMEQLMSVHVTRANYVGL